MRTIDGKEDSLIIDAEAYESSKNEASIDKLDISAEGDFDYQKEVAIILEREQQRERKQQAAKIVLAVQNQVPQIIEEETKVGVVVKAAKTTRKVKGKASGKKLKKMPMRKLDDLDMILQSDIDIELKGMTLDERLDEGTLKLNTPTIGDLEDLEKQY